MHNGGIAEFPVLKRRLQKDLPDVAFDMVQGNTGMSDSILSCLLLIPELQLLSRFGMGVRAVFIKGENPAKNVASISNEKASSRTLMHDRSPPKRCVKLWPIRLHH